MNGTSSQSPKTKKRRGPYRRWIAENTATCTGACDTATVVDFEKEKEEEHFDESSSCTDFDMNDTHDQGNSGLIFDYCPPNDFEDNDLDQLLSDLHLAEQKQRQDELADELPDVLNILEEEIMETTEHETCQMPTGGDSDEENPPLFNGSQRHLGITMLLICSFMVRFRLSQETMHYLLALMHLLLPDNSHLVTSLHGLKKYLAKFTFLPVVHYYCSHCYTHINKTAKCCANELCKKDLTQSGSVSYFVQHSLIAQLQILFKRASFTEQIRSHRFHHLNLTPNGKIRDIYDGELYQTLYQQEILNNPNNISFAMNTDGVAIFKSSKISMWPVYLIINELPVAQRKAKENILFYGIWISSKKPVMWSFLKPMYDELRKLEDGVHFEDHLGQTFLCKASLLTCTCDLPAKCLMTNSMQFNGKFGCWHCLQPGETHRTGKRGHCHVFPFIDNNPNGPVRTMENIKNDVKLTVDKIQHGEKDYMVNGIKGPFWLMFLNNFNFVDGFIIDYMHGVCEGVMKLLIKLWFKVEYKDQPFSAYESKKNVTEMLIKIKPTINITRVPRSLDELAYWKASEFRNFLLYWGIPILKNVLSNVYFVHFCLLVKSIYLLSKDDISLEDIAVAEACLHEFVRKFADLYSVRFMTMNIHQLVHLPQTVRQTGPLFVNNCFVFEDLNGFIVSHIHGTQGIDTQIIQTINIIQAIPILHEKFAKFDFEAIAFMKDMNGGIHKSLKCIQPGIFQIDKCKNKIVTQEEFLALSQWCNIVSNNVKCWLRLYITNSASYVYAMTYKRLTRRNQSVVKYVINGNYKFGYVRLFVNTEESTQNHVALITPFKMLSYNSKENIHYIQSTTSSVDVINLENIISTCLYVQTDNNNNYVCEMPNKYEKD